ncbi:hypothetical protein GCM10011374_40720 [Kocuria dechangensis]|uniref:Uncharacterized protein n=1 Tax=Kocuria dechangensis TaxID=1176249 RepID=A0A917H9R9_9MICC|nr:hypothetical protein GCM10011374_40720 [Kocuria dechangensis]
MQMGIHLHRPGDTAEQEVLPPQLPDIDTGALQAHPEPTGPVLPQALIIHANPLRSSSTVP